MSILNITQQGAYLRKRQGRFIVEKDQEELLSVPENAIEKVMIFGNVQITTQVISSLLAAGIEIIFLSRNGKFKGFLEPGFPKNCAIRLAQYQAVSNQPRALELAKQLISLKIQSEIYIIKRWRRNQWLQAKPYLTPIIHSHTAIDQATNTNEIMGHEAIAAKNYFNSLGQALPPEFEWCGRNRQPPQDPINALLSLTYMMMLSEIITLCYATALDPYLGVLHQPDYSRPSLALDLLEPFRAPYCDHFVMKLVQKETFNHDHFTYSETTGCRLKPAPFKCYLTEFENFKTQNQQNQPPCIKLIKQTIMAFKECLKTNTPLNTSFLPFQRKPEKEEDF